MAVVIGQDMNHPLKPSRRTFLKAMGAITGAALLPAAAAAELPFVPPVVMPSVLPPLPAFEPLLTPITGIRGLAVFLNGIMLQEGYDYVRTGENTVQFLTTPADGDAIEVGESYSTRGGKQIADGKSHTVNLTPDPRLI